MKVSNVNIDCKTIEYGKSSSAARKSFSSFFRGFNYIKAQTYLHMPWDSTPETLSRLHVSAEKIKCEDEHNRADLRFCYSYEEKMVAYIVPL